MRIQQGLKRVAVFGILLSGWVAAADAGEWYGNCKWSQMVTIDKSVTSSPLTNFPFLVAITNQDAAVFGRALSDGRDIVFTTEDGLTKLDHEIEVYSDTGSKRLIAWVKIPVLSSTVDTKIQMFYGDSSSTNQQNVVGVWSNGFLGVWHLNEAISAGGVNKDSSASLAHTVRYGSSPAGTAGMIGGGNAYNGTDDYSVGTGVVRGTNEFSVSAWVYANDANMRVFEQGDVNTEYLGKTADNKVIFSLSPVLNSQKIVRGAAVFTPGAWHYVVAMATTNAWDKPVYVDNVYGVSAGFGDVGLAAHKRAKYIGGLPNVTYCWNGKVDELRVESVKRSTTWIGACFNNQKNPET